MRRKVVLLGQDIGYSASPAIHAVAFASVGIDAEYAIRDIGPEELPEAVAALRQDAFLGANVTIPHKRAVVSLVDRRSSEVDRLGAANTLVHIGAELVAYNTDLPALRDEIADLRSGPFGAALILGAGGASAAARAALEDLGWSDVRVLSRDRWPDLEDELAVAGLLINATPIGTAGDDSPVPASMLRPDLAVLDLVYRPSPTRLVRDARKSGAPA
jgi:shikimate dehydrogenase